MADGTPWSEPFRLAELRREPVARRLAADAEARKRIARDLGLDRLDALQADLEISPWRDGVQVAGRWTAAYEQTCGVTLEPLPSKIERAFELRFAPADEGKVPREIEELVLDPEAEDPPDPLESDRLDLAKLLVEQLALEIDPFPRKPGAVFTPPEEERPPSPFSVLQDFKAPRS